MLCILIIAAYMSWASAVVYIKAPCPDVNAVGNFNLSKFGSGRWYEIARYPNDVERQGDCVTMEINFANDRYKFQVQEVIDDGLSYIDGYFILAPEAGNTGIVHVHSPNITQEEIDDLLPVHILDIDYNKYAILYECRYNKTIETRHDYLWILSRTKNLDGNVKTNFDNFMKSSNFINKDLLIWDHFNKESCKEFSHHL